MKLNFYILFFILGLHFTYVSKANFYLYNFNSQNYPKINFQLYFYDKTNLPITIENLEIYENNDKIDNFTISKLNDTISNNNLFVFVLDLSSSVDNEKKSLYYDFLINFLQNIDLTKNRYSIFGFNDNLFSLINPTNDIKILDETFKKLISFGNTNYNSIFNKDFNVLDLATKKNEKYHLIILNDGIGSLNYDEISKITKEKTLTISSISFYNPAFEQLKKLCNENNGLYFENISNKTTANNYSIILLNYLLGYKPYKISYESYTCNNNNILRLFEKKLQVNKLFEFSINEELFPKLETNKIKGYNFGKVEIGKSKKYEFILIAKVKDIKILDITESEYFKISGIQKGQTLFKDENYKISIEYYANDTNFHYQQIIFYTDVCQNLEMNFSAGVINSENYPRELRIIKPNGGEIIDKTQNTIIQWSGISPNDTLRIEFSRNNGVNWDVITNNATNLSFNWDNIPNIKTNQGLIKLKYFDKQSRSKNIRSLTGINGKIIDLYWAKNDNDLISSSSDGFIRLWDANKYEPIRTIYGGIRNLKFVSISNDEKYIAFVDEDSRKVKIINVNLGEVVKEFNFNENITAIDWSKNSNYLAVGTNDGLLSIFEYPNINPIYQKRLNNISITSLRFSLNGEFIACGNEEGRIFIYDLNGNIIFNVKNSDVRITDLSWNKSNKIITVATTLQNINTWDIDNQLLVQTFSEFKNPVTKIDWDPSLKYFISSNGNNSVNIWDPKDASFVYSFNFHTSQISSLKFSNQGNRIASGSGNGEAFIWKLSDIPFENQILVEDVSDSAFTITSPEFNIKNIDFGTKVKGYTYDTTISLFIENKGILPIKIDSIRLVGDTKDNFKILNFIDNNFVINNYLNLQVSFNPDNENLYLDTINIYSGNAIYRSILRGFGISQKIKLYPNYINFNDIRLGDTSYTQEIIIENLTNEEIYLEDINLNINDDFIFQNFNFEPLLPFEKRIFKVKYIPKKIGYSSSLNYIKFLDIPLMYYINLQGNGLAPSIKYNNSIEMPTVLCDRDTSISNLIISNLGNYKLIIDSIKISNDNFFINKIDYPTEIEPFDSIKVILNFKTDIIGFHQTNIKIFTNLNDNFQKEHKIIVLSKKEKLNYQLDKNQINYVVNINEEKSKEIKIINNSTVTLILNLENNFSSFQVLNEIPLIILPNEEKKLFIKFVGKTESGVYKDSLIFSDNCKNKIVIHLNAYVNIQNAKLQIPEFINFGEIYCTNYSNPKVIKIKNIGSEPLIIDDISIEEKDYQNFEITRLPTNYFLEPNQDDSILIRINSNKLGDLKSYLRIYSNSNNRINNYNEIELNGFVANKSIKIDVQEIFLDNLYLNKTFNFKFTVVNNGNIALYWDIKSFDLKHFKIDSIIPSIIAKNEISTFYLTFLGSNKITQINELLKFSNLCDTNFSINLIANVNKKAQIGIKAGTINAAPGDTINLPIYLYQIDNQPIPEITSLKTQIKFNATLLIPIELSSTVNENLIRTIEIEIPIINLKDNLIKEIPFRAYLGNNDSTLIILNNTVALNDTLLAFEETSGVFYLDSVCYNGGSRLIGSSGILRLFQNEPNPFTDITKIKFSIIEDGDYKLQVYDIIGNLCFNLELKNLKSGEYEVPINLKNLSQGNYFYLLKTPSNVLIRKMTINKN